MEQVAGQGVHGHGVVQTCQREYHGGRRAICFVPFFSSFPLYFFADSIGLMRIAERETKKEGEWR